VELCFELELLFDDGDEHIDRDGNPDLTLHCVLGGSEKSFDSQVLFDPLEEDLYLPPVTIEIGYCLCRDSEVVGQEVEGFVCFAGREYIRGVALPS